MSLPIRVRPVLLLLLSLIVAGGSMAQPSAKGGKSKAAAGERFATAPFPEAATQLDTIQRNSHDFMRLALAASKLPGKETFESTTEHQARTSKALGQRVYGDVSLGDMLMLRGLLLSEDLPYGDVHYEYNADAQELKVCFTNGVTGLGWSPELPFQTFLTLQVQKRDKSQGSYTGTNAFGASAKVQKSSADEVRLAVERSSTSGSCLGPSKQSPAEAKDTVNGALWGVVGTIRAPYLVVQEVSVAPTVTAPYDRTTTYFTIPFSARELILFNGRTGEVKLRLPF